MNGLSHFETFRSKATSQTMEIAMNIGAVDGTATDRGIATHERLRAMIENAQPGLLDRLQRENRIVYAFGDDYRLALKVFPVGAQVRAYRVLYPELGDNPSVGQLDGDLSYGAEGRFLVPNIWKNPSPLSGDYGELVLRVMGMFPGDGIKCFDGFNPDMIQQTSSARNIMEGLSKEQGFPDLLVFDAQLGMMYKDLSPLEALASIFAQQQFPIGLFAGLNIILLHPARLRGYMDPDAVFSGDEYVTTENVTYRVTFGLERSSNLSLFIDSVNSSIERRGNLSGFIPKRKP